MDDKKFIDIIDVDDFEVWTESGFVSIDKVGKTIEYDVYKLELQDGKILKGADNHIVITTSGPKYMKDLKPIEDAILTETGMSAVKSIEKLDYSEHMYDLQLEESIQQFSFHKKDKTKYSTDKGPKKICDIDENHKIKVNSDYKDIVNIFHSKQSINVSVDLCNHTYYTNGILSHNTLFMTHLTTGFIKNNYNVLYVTLEMSEFEINKRIDANLLNFPMKEFIPANSNRIKELFTNFLSNNKLGKLKTVEYPSGSCTVMTIRNLLNKLRREEKFFPDVVVVDQINTMADLEKNSSTYLKIKNIVEGLKAISTEFDCVVLSATQANRETLNKKDINMENISESMATAQIADLIIGLMKEQVSEDDMIENPDKGYVRCKVIKNRLNGINIPPFMIEQDFKYMRLKDVR